jgi:glycosyltransferase involved in cell wall biosynthesis
MNIGLITPWFERGAGNVSIQYHEALSKSNKVFIYARGGAHYEKKDEKWSKFNVTYGLRIPSYARDQISSKHLSRWIINNKIDILFFNEQVSWEIIFWLKLNMPEIKIGAYIDYYTEETLLLFDMYDFLICNTKKHFSAFNWHPQAYFIQWGTSKSNLNYNENNVGKKAPVFFHSSGLNPHRKGTDFLIRAFDKIENEDAKLIIHSQNELLFQEDDLNKIINSKNIEIIEKTIPLPGLYNLGDVYVYPSRLEGIGLTIAEALMSGLPAIVPDAAPMNEFVEHLKTGWLVKIDRFVARYDGYYWPQSFVDLDSLKSGMEFFINNFSEMRKFKKNARVSAETFFDWEKQHDAVNKVFGESKVKSPESRTVDMCKKYILNKNQQLPEIMKMVLSKAPLPSAFKNLIYSSILKKKWESKIS